MTARPITIRRYGPAFEAGTAAPTRPATDASEPAGDAVIVESAHRLQSVLRTGDVVGRLGGDEFVVLLLGGGDHDERELPRRITERLAEPMGIQGLTVTASVGLAVASEFESADQVLGRADLAMYAAKSLGGNTVAALRSDAEGARRLGVMPSGRS